MQRDQLEEIVGSPLTTEREFILIGIASKVRELAQSGDTEALAHYVQHVAAINMGLQDQVAVYRTSLHDLAARVQRHDINGVIPLRQVIHDWFGHWMSKISN